EQRQVRLEIGHKDLRWRKSLPVRGLELEVGRVGHHFGGGQHLAGSDDCSERASTVGSFLLPWLASAPGLLGGIDPYDRSERVAGNPHRSAGPDGFRYGRSGGGRCLAFAGRREN